MKTQMKLSLLAFSLAGLVACSSGGGGSADGTPKETVAPQTHSDQPHTQTGKNTLPTIPNTTVPLSPNLAQQIKEQKVVELYVSEINEKPTKNTQFLMLSTDFGTKPIELDNFPRYQLVQENYTNKYLTGDNKAEEEGGYVRVYNQTYSAIVAESTLYHIVESGRHSTSEDNYQIFDVVGVHTTKEQLPNNQATYKGIAFDDHEQGGKITYQVDFANKTGSGEITGLERYGKISLHQGSIRNLTNEDQEWVVYKDNNQGIKSAATSEKMDNVSGYELLFFGPNAEEISGFVKEAHKDTPFPTMPDYKIGFGATKQ